MGCDQGRSQNDPKKMVGGWANYVSLDHAIEAAISLDRTASPRSP